VGEFVQNLNLDTRLPLPLTPAATLRTELEYGGLTDTYLFLAAETILAQNRVDRNERTTPGAFLIDIGFGTQLKLGKRRLHLSARLDNLLNTPYFNHISRYRLINLPEQGRNLVVSAKIPLYTNI
jgi:iron complex outermembrane receptor protein